MTDCMSDKPDSSGSNYPPVIDRPNADAVLAALAEARHEQKQSVSATLTYGLSDLTAAEWQRVSCAWDALPAPTKERVLRSLVDSSEALFELSYRELGLQNLEAKSGAVRAAAIELLWTDESERVMRELMRLADRDRDPSVRAGALKALGRFILLGEYGDISELLAQEAQGLLLRLYTDKSESLEIRRRALESLANASHPLIPGLVSDAYENGNHDLKISAIFAMGRTCSPAWREILLDELGSHDNEVVYEAATACGQIQLEDSVPRIGELAVSEDREIQHAAIWALGEIGGRRAFEILERLNETVDGEETVAVLEEALDAAGFRRSVATLDLELEDD